MGIDLSGARETYADLVMVDTCVITHNTGGVRDATLNETSGELEGAGLDPTTLYTGRCSASELSDQQRQLVEIAGVPKTEKIWKVVLPWDADLDVPIGAVVTITTSRDTSLAGKPLYVRNARWATNQVARRLLCTRRIDAVDSR